MGAFSSLKDDCARWLGRDRYSDVDLEASLDRMLKNAQDRIAREWNFTAWNVEEALNATPGEPWLPRSKEMLANISLAVRLPNSQTHVTLRQRDIAWVQAWWADVSKLGVPRYFAIYDYNDFYLAPTPDKPYALRHLFRRKPSYLRQDQEDNDMSNRFYDALLALMVLEGADFSQEDRRDAIRTRAEERYQQIRNAAGFNELARINPASQGGNAKAP